MSELHFMRWRDEPVILLSTNRYEKDLFTGWLFKFDKDGYTKHYDFGYDLKKCYPVNGFDREKLRRNIIQFILFRQETEYKRDMVLDALSEITRIIW